MTPTVSITLLRTQTDQRLVELIAAGHDRAFEAIVDRYRRPLLRYARRFLHEDARAEDVVQSAFVSAWTALNEGATVRDLRPWLYRIVHNGALNVMKKPGLDDAVLIEASDLRPGPAAEVEQREDVRQALDTISRLPERQRTALLAVAFDGRSHADVGEELGLKEPAVRQLVSRARVSLRVAATAVTPWPVAAWLAGIGGAAASDTAGRVGEIVGGVGAGTVFGGGALKAGALVAAAGAVAVGAPKMAEVAHHHAHRPVATASASTASNARSGDGSSGAGAGATAPGSAPTKVPTARFRVVSNASGGLTAGARAHGRSGGSGTSGGWSRHAPTTPSSGWTHRPSGSGSTGDVAEPRSGGNSQSGAEDNSAAPTSPTRHRERHRSSETQDSTSGDGTSGDTSRESTGGDSKVFSGTGGHDLNTEHSSGDSTEKAPSTSSGSGSGGGDSQGSAEHPETPESSGSQKSGDQPAATPVPAPAP